MTNNAAGRLLHGDITDSVLSAFFATYRELGPGFLERVYANGISVLLREAGVAVAREVPYEIIFHGENIGLYRADLVAGGKVVVEVKAARAIDERHGAQVLNYLRASGLEVGLLLNFGAKAEFKRIICTRDGRERTSQEPSR